MSCTGSMRRGFWGFWKKSVSWVPDSEEEDWFSLARRSQASGLVAGATRVGGGADGKASIERLCLSPYVEKPFNSKVIKSFVPELRSQKCFLCFGIPMFYVYMLWTFYVHFTYPYHGYGTTLWGVQTASLPSLFPMTIAVTSCAQNISSPPVVENELKAPFSIVTTTKCRGGHYSFP